MALVLVKSGERIIAGDGEGTNFLMGTIPQNLKPTIGFGPITPGLQNQSSTVELRWQQSILLYKVSLN